MRTETESDIDFTAALSPRKTPSVKPKSTYFYEWHRVQGREYRKRLSKSKLRQSIKPLQSQETQMPF